MSFIAKLYDQKILERIKKDVGFLAFFSTRPIPETPEETHHREVSNKWYERRLARVRKVMEAYHISASALCDCDY